MGVDLKKLRSDNYYRLHPGVAVGQSSMHGRGTFAIRDIPGGALLLVMGGYLATVQEEAELPQAMQDAGVQIAPDLVLTPKSGELAGGISFVNHCCDPNAGFHGQIFLVAMRDIARGEEITFDYAMCLGDGPHIAPYSLECRCGSVRCRGWITDRDWTIPELQARYRGFFQPYLQTRIEQNGLNSIGKMRTPSHIPEVIVTIGISQMLPGQMGLFAARDLMKRSILVPISEFEVFHWEWDELDKLDSITREKIIGFCVGTPSGFFAPRNLNHISVVWYMNHSCEPNVGFDENENFVLMRDVRAGEELFWDYGFAETNPKFAMPCNCMSKSCRKIITGNDWENSDYRKRNEDFLSPSLRRLCAQPIAGSDLFKPNLPSSIEVQVDSGGWGG